MRGRILQLVVAVLKSSWIVFIAAFAMRVVVLMQLLPEESDRFFYHNNEAARIAWAMVSGHGFSSPWPNTPLAPSAQQPPLYPFLLAGIFKFTGAYSYISLWLATLLNALFSSLTAVLIRRLGRLAFDDLVGILASWVWACWSYEASVSIRLWESSLSTLLLTVSFLLLFRCEKSGRAFTWAFLGSVIGIAALSNTSLLSVLPFFWAWLWWRQRPANKDIWRRLTISTGVCFLTVLPWTVRNYMEFKQVIPIRDNFGMELWIGNHEGVKYLYDFSSGFPLTDPKEYSSLGEIRFMNGKRAAALAFIRHNPGTFLRLIMGRVGFFWSAPTAWVWVPIAVTAWFGLILAWRQRSIAAVPFTFALTLFPLVYYITHPRSTYRHPIEPIMILLVAYVFFAVVRFMRRRSATA